MRSAFILILSLAATSPARAQPDAPAAKPTERAADVAIFDVAAAQAIDAVRARAARILEAALDSSDESRKAMTAAALAASATLGADSLLAQELRTAAAADLDDDALVRAIESAQSTLAFARSDEEPLPVGFPPPAPVGEVVLKSYPQYRMARAPMENSGMSGSFMKLFRHIQREEIAMTVPVQMDYEKAQEGAENRRPRPASMAFLYRRPDMGETGSDGDVEIVDIEPRLMISIGARGYDSAKQTAELRDVLSAWIEQRSDAFEAAGPARVMVYNGPSVTGLRRYYEVEMPVQKKNAASEQRQPTPADAAIKKWI